MLGIWGVVGADGVGAAVNVGGVLGSNESSRRVLTSSGLMTGVVSLAGKRGSVGVMAVSASTDSLAIDGAGEDVASFSVGGNDGS